MASLLRAKDADLSQLEQWCTDFRWTDDSDRENKLKCMSSLFVSLYLTKTITLDCFCNLRLKAAQSPATRKQLWALLAHLGKEAPDWDSDCEPKPMDILLIDWESLPYYGHVAIFFIAERSGFHYWDFHRDQGRLALKFKHWSWRHKFLRKDVVARALEEVAKRISIIFFSRKYLLFSCTPIARARPALFPIHTPPTD